MEVKEVYGLEKDGQIELLDMSVVVKLKPELLDANMQKIKTIYAKATNSLFESNSDFMGTDNTFPVGLTIVQKNGKYGYINKKGIEVIPCQYDNAFAFKDGFAVVRKNRNRKYGYIDQNGKEITPFEYDDAGIFYEGLAVVRKNTKWGYINQTGKEVIPCQYDDANNFREGLAMVKKGRKWGYVDPIGLEVIPCQYDYAGAFHEGLALVKKDGRYSYIDKTGKEVCQHLLNKKHSVSFPKLADTSELENIIKALTEVFGSEEIPCYYDVVNQRFIDGAKIRIGIAVVGSQGTTIDWDTMIDEISISEKAKKLSLN